MDQAQLIAMQAEAAGSYASQYLINAQGSYSLRVNAAGVLLNTVYTVAVSIGNIRVGQCSSAISGWTAGSNLTAGAALGVDITARDKGVTAQSTATHLQVIKAP